MICFLPEILYDINFMNLWFYAIIILQSSKDTRMQEFQNHLEKIETEKMQLENQVYELSSYQNEVMLLRNEISKLQVN